MVRNIKEALLDWFSEKLQPLVERKFIMKDTYQLEKVEHKGVKLPYVLLINKAKVINKFRIPMKLENINLDIFNKEMKVGSVVFDESTRIKPRNKQDISVEVRLNHITALFQMLRFLIIDTIRIDVRGEIQIKFLGMTFFIPVHDQVDIPRSKLIMITQTVQDDTSIPTDIPFEDISQEHEVEINPPTKLSDE